MKEKFFSVLGDSYSTFQGYIPENYSCYYPIPEQVADVLRVEDTWWHRLQGLAGLSLLINNSYSGSTVCTDVRPGQPATSSYVYRSRTVDFGAQGQSPDYILVFGGTNDSWLERSAGQPVYENPNENRLTQVLPAFCQVLDTLGKRYPNAQVLAVINTELDPQISEGMLAAAAHYGVTAVALENIDKQCGHPTARGMESIARQVADALRQ